MGVLAADPADRLIEQGLDALIRAAVGRRRGTAKLRVRRLLEQLRPLLWLLARAIRLRLAQMDAPTRLDVDVTGSSAGRALQARLPTSGPVGELLARRPRFFESWGHSLAGLVAGALREQQTGPRRTPRTRLSWSTLGEWLRMRQQLDNRPPSAAKNAAWDEHHAALSQATVNTGTAAELAQLQQIAGRAHHAAWQDWIYLAQQDVSGRLRKLAHALRRAAEQRLPREVSCTELVAAGYPSAAAAARLGEKRLEDVQRLLAPDLHVAFDAARCAYALRRAKDCRCARCASARPV